MGASFQLVFKAHIKRSNFYIIIAIFGALCFLAALYDVFTLGATSTLFSEVYAGLALLLAVSVALFCLGDFIERERDEETFALSLIRPQRLLTVLLGRFLGAWLATTLALAVLSVVYYTSVALLDTYSPPAAHFIFPVTVAAASLSCALTLFFSITGGFLASAVALLGLLTASHLLAYFSQKVPSLTLLLIILPNFHIANLQNDCAIATSPQPLRLILSVASNIAYAFASLLLLEMLLRLRYEPSE